MPRPPRKSPNTDALVALAFARQVEAVIVTTPARTIVAANEAACALFSPSGTELAGTPLRALYAAEADWLAASDAIRSGAPASHCVTLHGPADNLFDADVAILPLYDRDQIICGVVETFRPLTRDEAEIARADGSVRDDARALRLARGMAHDLNNLLAIITGSIQLAQMQTRDDTVARYLRDAEQACEMAAQLTHRASKFARDQKIVPTRCDLAEFFAGRTAIFRAVVSDQSEFAVNLADNLPAIEIDQIGLENAIINVLRNARDAMPEGGRVLIEVGRVPSSPNHGCVRIAISDTGTGMTGRVTARAFDPFFTTKPAGQGTGLGLASVHGFAVQSGGTADIDSALGRGTTVSLTLPMAR